MNIINNHLCFVQELSLLVEEQERDGEGDVAVRLLAQSSSGTFLFWVRHGDHYSTGTIFI